MSKENTAAIVFGVGIPLLVFLVIFILCAGGVALLNVCTFDSKPVPSEVDSKEHPDSD